MSVQRETLYVDGMTCPACEARIANSLLAIEGVSAAQARIRGGRVEVEYDPDRTGTGALRAAIEKTGYTVRDKRGAGTVLALGIGLLLAAAYLVASASGLFSSLPAVDASIGYAMLFVVGLLTSIHCVAMCGGIALSQSLRAAPGPALAPAAPARAPDRLALLKPGILYNAGRVLSYTVIGAFVGALGSAFDFSPAAKGAIAAAAGVFMVFLGLRMLGLLKGSLGLARLVPTRLRESAARLRSAVKDRGPVAVGLLNGLMPCGPLQTMQLYALGTGSVLAGAFSMLIFSLGTVPLMLVFGVTAALLPRRFVPLMVKASAVLVMFLGVVTFGRAAALAGIPLPDFSAVAGSLSSDLPALRVGDRGPAGEGIQAATLGGGVQTIVTEFKDGYYVPFAVQAGVPLKWTIRIKSEDLNGCNNPIVVPAYGIKKELVAGDNLVEFTPSTEGVIAYSCWMGMIQSRIAVLRDLSGPVAAQLGEQALPGLLGLGSPGGGCCSGSANPAFSGGRIPVENIGMPVIRNGVQEISVTVGAQGYHPAAIILQKGMKAIIRFKPEALSSCNNPVVFPEFNGALDLSKGELETPAIPVTADFTFQCWMGMIHGYAKAVDDLAKVDIDKVREELGKYRAPGGRDGLRGEVRGQARELSSGP